ncbi:endo alpha-1,4 polygalactosaminidase [Streptomyces sp. C10-9-1]|uniref:endo alpha-1,4 polygalactosaminidase n=1 Tax=Streptomyces sp. C10-9-1 TaxID=1859285 RepID=UPI0021126D14|nr:endo alpha-1,4 polygalactosaminidase [Streptomyces sp. C10-9-1]MCQ6556229.1 endo alpha-1,4 polygalactosaminidase [Streptomyces sp. C10-9-1]
MRRGARHALVALLVLAAAGCSSDGGEPGARGPDRSSPAPRPPASTGPPAGTASPGTPPSASASAPSPGRTSGTPGPGASSGPGGRWQPRPGLAWQWQLDGRVDPSVDVPVYDIDGFENSAADVARLKRDGRRVICYINAGAWEDYRPDQEDFPRSLLGSPNGWHGERWLDIRRTDVLRPLMERRFDMCRDKGFDAVEPDLLEGYANDTGFPLSADDQLRYNLMIAEIAHDRGLAVGLKNDLAHVPVLVDHFDFAVNEECAEFDECERLEPFVAAGKAVFHVEYEERTEEFCADSRDLGLSSMRKRLDLDVWRDPC